MTQWREVSSLALAGGLPDGLDGWLVEFIGEALAETAILLDNGATSAAAARESLIRKLIQRADVHLSEYVSVKEAAEIIGSSTETVRRRVRDGSLADERDNPRGHIRVKRGELAKVAGKKARKYDPVADAQDVAKLRRTAA